MILSIDSLLEQLNMDLGKKVKKLEKKPTLSTIRIGNNSGVISYEKSILKSAKNLGFDIDTNVFDENDSEEKIRKLIISKNEDNKVNGILIFSPAKNHDIDEYFNLISLEKDVDGQNSKSIINLFNLDYINVATTALATLEYLQSITDLNSKDILVINRSKIIGIPLSFMLQKENATVTIAHSKTKNIYEKIKNSDIVISAIGKPEILKIEDFKENAIVIDIGYSIDKNGNVRGDFDSSNFKELNIKYLPPIDGIGRINSNIILRNTYINEVRNAK